MKLTKLEKKIRNAKLDNLNHPSHPHTHHHPMPTPLPPPPHVPHAHPATAPFPHTHYPAHSYPASHYPHHLLHYPHSNTHVHLSARDPPIYRQECFSSYAGHSHLSPYNYHAIYYPSNPIPISMPSHFVYNHQPRLLQMPNCHSAAQPTSTCSPTPPINCPVPDRQRG